MSTLDRIAPKLTSKLISKFGKAITYIDVAEGTYDTATSKQTNVETPYNIMAIVEEWPAMRRTITNTTNGSLVLDADRIVTIAATSVPGRPRVGNKMIIDGITYVIVDKGIQAIYSGQNVASYVLVGRTA